MKYTEHSSSARRGFTQCLQPRLCRLRRLRNGQRAAILVHVRLGICIVVAFFILDADAQRCKLAFEACQLCGPRIRCCGRGRGGGATRCLGGDWCCVVYCIGVSVIMFSSTILAALAPTTVAAAPA